MIRLDHTKTYDGWERQSTKLVNENPSINFVLFESLFTAEGEATKAIAFEKYNVEASWLLIATLEFMFLLDELKLEYTYAAARFDALLEGVEE